MGQSVTLSELRATWSNAQKKGEYFEYECIMDGKQYVRNTDLGYCELLQPNVALKRENDAPNRFYGVIRSAPGTPEDGQEFSDRYWYYYDEVTAKYYAVKKKV